MVRALLFWVGAVSHLFAPDQNGSINSGMYMYTMGRYLIYNRSIVHSTSTSTEREAVDRRGCGSANVPPEGCQQPLPRRESRRAARELPPAAPRPARAARRREEARRGRRVCWTKLLVLRAEIEEKDARITMTQISLAEAHSARGRVTSEEDATAASAR